MPLISTGKFVWSVFGTIALSIVTARVKPKFPLLGLADDDGDWLADGDRLADGEIDAEGLNEADGERDEDGDSEAEADGDSLELALGETDDDGEMDGEGEGLTDALGLSDGEPILAMLIVSQTFTPLVASRSE